MQFPAHSPGKSTTLSAQALLEEKAKRWGEGKSRWESSLDLEEGGHGKNSPRAAGCCSVSVIGLKQVWNTVQAS